MSWLCSCGLVNSSLNEICPGSLASWKKGISHYQIAPNSPDELQCYLIAKELGMTQQEELFAKLYNHQKVLVKDMDHIQIREHREELQQIAFEAKARLSATDDELRERKAKTNNKEWLVTDTTPNINVSESINAVKLRTVRMSKMDKIRAGLKDAGIEEDTIKEMVRNLEQRATNKDLKTITFKKPAANEISAVQVKPSSDGDKPKFDPSSLGFNSEK